jgi:hypothetical protein
MRVRSSIRVGVLSRLQKNPKVDETTKGGGKPGQSVVILKKREDHESCCVSCWVKPIVGKQRFRAGLKLQGRPKPEMEAGFLTGISGPFSEIIAGRGNPLWCCKRECASENGRKPCEAGNGEGAMWLETVPDRPEVRL